MVQRAPLGGSFSDLTTVTTLSASDTSIDPYTTYQYQVVAITSAGRSAASNEITVGPPPSGFTNAAPAANLDVAGNYDLLNWKTCAAAGPSITDQYQHYPGSVAVAYGANDKLYLLWWDSGDSGTGDGVLMYREPPVSVPAAPAIGQQNGVLNDASFLPGILGGSWVAIFGANFTSVTDNWGNANFSNGLPTALDGVSVTFNGQPAAVFYISPTQIDVQPPSPLAGAVTVQVSGNGVASNTVTVQALPNSPGLFTYPAGSTLFPAAEFLDGSIVGDPALNAQTRKAHPGERLVLYATGLTSSPAGQVINAPIPTGDPVTAKIGGANTTVEFAGLVEAGLFQINIVIPSLADGNYPITISIDGQTSQPNVIIPIQN